MDLKAWFSSTGFGKWTPFFIEDLEDEGEDDLRRCICGRVWYDFGRGNDEDDAVRSPLHRRWHNPIVCTHLFNNYDSILFTTLVFVAQWVGRVKSDVSWKALTCWNCSGNGGRHEHHEHLVKQWMCWKQKIRCAAAAVLCGALRARSRSLGGRRAQGESETLTQICCKPLDLHLYTITCHFVCFLDSNSFKFTLLQAFACSFICWSRSWKCMF